MVFDNLITSHNTITYTVSSVEQIYIEQALKLLPTHVLSKFISEGWKIIVFDDVNELIQIDTQLTVYATGVTKYDLRRVFVKGLVDGRNEISFKSTLIHEIIHAFDCILDGSYCNWKTEKYYNNEIENLITEEGSNFSDYAQSDVKEYVATVVSRYILEQSDFTNMPLTKAFIEKYFYMNESSIEQRLQNLENNAVTYIEYNQTYNRLNYSKLNKENDKYVIQLSETSGGGTSNTNNNVVYDNNVTLFTNVSYFSLNKTTISYISETISDLICGVWELTTIMGDSSAVAVQYRRFILDSRNSGVTDFTTIPQTQRRFFDYNITRSWTDWQECNPSLAPNDVKGLLSNRIVLQVDCNVARSISAYNYYVIFKEVDKDDLYVLNYYPVTNSSNLTLSDNVFYNYQTFSILGVGSTSYVPKQPCVNKTSSKNLSSSSTTYWIDDGNGKKTCSSIAKLNNTFPSAKFDIVCVTCLPYLSSSNTSATDLTLRIYLGLEESNTIVTENTQLTKVIEYTMDGSAVAKGEIQTWIADGYNFETDILPLITNYDDTKI